MFGRIDKIELLKSQYTEQEGGIYSFIYLIETKGEKIEYSIHLKKTELGIFIRGFNFKITITTITPLHIIVGTLFTVCIVIQLWCVIYFTRKKSLKRKWLYIISSFLGFPAGVGINWATGAFILRFGFNIPAVGISWPLNQPGVFIVSVFFPIGLVLLIIENNKKAKSSAFEKVEVIDS